MLGKINIQLCSTHTALTLPSHTRYSLLQATRSVSSAEFTAHCVWCEQGSGAWGRKDGEMPSLTPRSL